VRKSVRVSKTPSTETLEETRPGENKASLVKEGLQVRKLALDVLLSIERQPRHRHKTEQLIESVWQKKQTPETVDFSDRRLLQALVTGVLRWQIRLDAWLIELTDRPLHRIEPAIRCLLRLGLFQLQGLDSIPSYAAINTTVALARQETRSEPTVKFVNAVLRQAQRRLEDGSLPGSAKNSLPEELSLPERLFWQAAWPKSWTESLLKTYLPESVSAMAVAWQNPAPLVLRVNTLKTTLEDFQEALTAADIVWESCYIPEESSTSATHLASPLSREEEKMSAEALRLVERKLSIQSLPGYSEGWFYIQDLASMWVSPLLQPQPGELILDLCAAPGSKTSQIAALSQNKARICAVELSPDRARRLQENLDRLGVENVTVIVADALSPKINELLTTFAPEGFDKVLVDAPCSGSGTIRRHPEILRHLSPPKPISFTDTQLALLRRGAAALKPGGLLVYSTCSLLPEENTQLVKRFLSKNDIFYLEFEQQRLLTENADGFYAAILRNQIP
jgi:16S rRNA (cytosine967-C5)-methyltransferase